MRYLFTIMGLLSFFWSNSQTKDNGQKGQYETLSESLKIVFRDRLERDEEKSYDEEFIRTTNLEHRLVNQYGFEAIKLIFEYRNSENYFNLGSFPAECPWSKHNNKKIPEFIEANFRPIKKGLPRLIATLKERCQFIYAEYDGQTWYLHYYLNIKLHDGRNYYRVYTGGPPNTSPKAGKRLTDYNWVIPPPLADFYRVHDGFGEIYDANYIIQSQDLAVLAEMMTPISIEEGSSPEGYAFSDLLEFFPDGTGNVQCFLRDGMNISMTVDWDHERWEISEPTDFFTFIEENLSEVDEE